MEYASTAATITALICLFLFAITKFSHQIEKNAGAHFRSFIRVVTRTPVYGALAGFTTAAIFQSSSATMVIAVSLVHAGIMSFTSSLGVLIGANVGTTLTTQLVAFKITAIAPYFLIAGLLLHYFGRGYKHYGKPLFYFGLVFFTLFLIQNILATVAYDSSVVAFFAALDNVWIAAFFGALAALILQSSTIVTSLIVLLVGSGTLSFDIALPLVIGANMGTTSTALIAALPLKEEARQTAIGNILFNLIGSLAFLLIIKPFGVFVQMIGGSPEQQVANAHLFFNLTCAICALILVKPFELFTLKVSSLLEVVFAKFPRLHELS
jgi:phosphate:Na+ symporter